MASSCGLVVGIYNMAGTIVCDDTVVSLATAGDHPLAGWLFPVYCTCGLVVQNMYHLLGALWAPSTSLSLSVSCCT